LTRESLAPAARSVTQQPAVGTAGRMTGSLTATASGQVTFKAQVEQ
jgi:hypothetical protein